MIIRLYSIEDTTAGEFGEPFPCSKDEVAKRSFGLSVNDDSSMLSLKPNDFNLWYVGTFDTSTGTILPDKPTKLANGSSLKEG